jgi:hypothetical protein
VGKGSFCLGEVADEGSSIKLNRDNGVTRSLGDRIVSLDILVFFTTVEWLNTSTDIYPNSGE